MMTFFGLAHMVDATQLLGWGGVGWGRDDDILWTWTHGGCYAHMVDATQLLGWGGVGCGQDDDILSTCTHGGCYATAGVGWGGLGMMAFFELAQEARLTNRRCRKRIEAWGSRRKDCMIWAVPRKKGPSAARAKVRVAANMFYCLSRSLGKWSNLTRIFFITK